MNMPILFQQSNYVTLIQQSTNLNILYYSIVKMNQTKIPYAIIAVKEPILQHSPKDNSPPYVTYLITGQDPHGIFNIRRRFREFDILRIKFVERFIGLYIPSIPSKKITGNTEDRIVEDRQIYLDLFCQKIAQKPYLFDCDIFQTFIRGDPDFQRASRYISNHQYALIANIYDVQFRKDAEQSDIPKITAQIQDEAQILRLLQKRLVANRNKLIEVVECRKQFINQFKQCYQLVLPRFEQEFIKMHDPQQKSIFIFNNNTFNEKSKEYFNFCDANVIQDYVELITYDIHEVRAFLEAIQSRKKFINKKITYGNTKKSSLQQLDKLKNGRMTLKSIFSIGNKDDLIKELEDHIPQYERNEAFIDMCLPFSAIALFRDLHSFKKSRSIDYLNKLQIIAMKQMRLVDSYGKMLSAALERPQKLQSQPQKPHHFSFSDTKQEQRLQPKIQPKLTDPDLKQRKSSMDYN